MTQYIAARGVRLSSRTKLAWKEQGVTFAHPDRNTQWFERWVTASPGDWEIINLGDSSLDVALGIPMWNRPETILQLVWPGNARALLDEYMPPRPAVFPAEVWIKAPGSHGRGKYKKSVERSLVLPKAWDWQQHIPGQEFRLITVGHRVVQQHMRYGENGDRSYEWLRMRDVDSRLKNMARAAARQLPGRNIIAWDMILSTDNQPFILEGNTCPGMNSETAERIIREMQRVSEEGAIAWHH